MNLDIGLMAFDLQAVSDYARRAEEMGFDAIWSAETRHDSRSDFTFHASTMVVLGDTEEELRKNARAVKRQIAFYASARTHQAALAVHGLEDLVPRPHAKSLAGDREGLADLISNETLDHFAVSGSFATIEERIRGRYRGLYDRAQLYPSFQPALDDPRWPAVLAGFRGA